MAQALRSFGLTLLVTQFVALAGAATAAFAQLDPYPLDSQLKYQVWNGSEWTSTVVARPGDRIEMRVVVSYTGTQPVVGLGRVAYQPIFSNWDNDGPSMDNLGAWRNGGVNSALYHNGQSEGYLSPAEGASGAALADYGRVSFVGIATQPSFFNVLSAFRHSDRSNGAPSGSWMRISGSFGSQWPGTAEGPLEIDDGNRILRGVVSAQLAKFNTNLLVPGNLNRFWIGGSTDVALFRQAVLLSDLATSRTISITSEQSSLDRAGANLGTTDNRRFMTWRTTEYSNNASGDLRTGVDIIPAQIIVSPYIPAPSAFALLAMGGVVAHRRRR